MPKKYSSNDSRQIRSNDALTSLVAETLLPLSIVESSAFRQFVECLDPHFVVPLWKHLSTNNPTYGKARDHKEKSSRCSHLF